jgi:hypothetical protein
MVNKRCTSNKVELRKVYEEKMKTFMNKQQKKNDKSKS